MAASDLLKLAAMSVCVLVTVHLLEAVLPCAVAAAALMLAAA